MHHKCLVCHVSLRHVAQLDLSRAIYLRCDRCGQFYSVPVDRPDAEPVPLDSASGAVWRRRSLGYCEP